MQSRKVVWVRKGKETIDAIEIAIRLQENISTLAPITATSAVGQA